MQDKKIIALMTVLGLLVGGAAVMGFQAYAQQNPPASQPQAQAQSQAVPNTQSPTGSCNCKHGSSLLGGDGVISSINGTTIVISEEANEGGASYTVDASAITNLPSIKVGDKIFVQGTVNGTSVKATSISLKKDSGKENENDANDPNENETSAAE